MEPAGCDLPEEKLWSWWDRQAPELADHLAACSTCRRRVAAFDSMALALEAAATPVPGPPPPAQLGPYRVLGRLGEGGMGVVYEAEDPRLGRRVAVKLFKEQHRDPEAVEHFFRREVRTLARLRHPGIAQVHTAGRAAGNRPYLVMELVPGVPLTRYAREQELGHEERLRLFVRLCRAVQHAHEHGVIHRDLKPGNILVAPPESASDDRVRGCILKVLDFGLARLADDAAASRNTRPGQVLGTLPYMSPEQVRGEVEDVDVRSDVYSLGVILYELLTGRLPHDVADTPLPAAARAIAESPPRRPSQLDRRLRGDLETILLTALAKEPARRYASAAALADDVERFLEKLPITARPPSALYHLHKLVQRHRLAAGLAAALLLALAALAGLSTWHAARIQDALDRATAAEARARQNLERLEAVLDAADPYGDGATVRSMLDHAWEDLRSNPPADPLVQSRLGFVLARAYRRIGAYREALKILDHLAAAGVPPVGDPMAWPALKAEVLVGLGRHGEAERLAAAVVRARREGANDRGPAALASALEALADCHMETGDLTAAEAEFREAAELLGSVAGRERDRLRVTRSLAACLRIRGRLDQAEALLAGVRARLEALGPAGEVELADCLAEEAELLRSRGRMEAAVEACRRALDLLEGRLGPSHPDLCPILGRLAVLLTIRREMDAAETVLQRAITVARQHLGTEHPVMARLLLRLSLLRRHQGRREEALAAADQALAVARSGGDRDDPRVAEALEDRARALRDLRRLAQAETAAREALDIRRRSQPGAHPDRAASLELLGSILLEARRFEEAAQVFEECQLLYLAALGPDRPNAARALLRLGVAWKGADRPDRAMAAWLQAIELRRGRSYATGSGQVQTLEKLVRTAFRAGTAADRAAALRALEDVRADFAAQATVDPELLARLSALASWVASFPERDASTPPPGG